jgi:hypothetical protein
MRRFEGHQSGTDETRCSTTDRTRSRQSSLNLATSEHAIAPFSRHPKNTYVGLTPVDSAEFMCLQELEEFPAGEVSG